MLRVADRPEGQGDCRAGLKLQGGWLCQDKAGLSHRRAGQTDNRTGKIAESCVFSHFLGIFKVSWDPLGTEGRAKLSTLSVPSSLLSDVLGYQACVHWFQLQMWLLRRVGEPCSGPGPSLDTEETEAQKGAECMPLSPAVSTGHETTSTTAEARNWSHLAVTISLLAHRPPAMSLPPVQPFQSACFSSPAPPPPPPRESRPPGISGRVQLHPYHPVSSSRLTSSRFCWVISDLLKSQTLLGAILCPLPAMFPSCLKSLGLLMTCEISTPPRPAPLASWWLGKPSSLRTLAHAVTCLRPLACELQPQQHVRTQIFPRVTPDTPATAPSDPPGPWDTPNHYCLQWGSVWLSFSPMSHYSRKARLTDLVPVHRL